MTYEDFKKMIIDNISVGEVLKNPRKGTSTIKRINDETIVYTRKNSNIYLKFEKLYSAYKGFQGRFVTTNDLKKFDNSFDSEARKPSGHSCNCTFGFMLLTKIGLADGITQKDRLLGTNFLKK